MGLIPVYVGIDVAQDRLDVCVGGEEQVWQVGNDTAGIAALRERLLALAPQGIVLEATGGFEREVALELALAGCRCRWRTRGRCGTLPALRDGWRRRTPSMRGYWCALARQCSPRCAPCRTRRRKSCGVSWYGGGRW